MFYYILMLVMISIFNLNYSVLNYVKYLLQNKFFTIAYIISYIRTITLLFIGYYCVLIIILSSIQLFILCCMFYYILFSILCTILWTLISNILSTKLWTGLCTISIVFCILYMEQFFSTIICIIFFYKYDKNIIHSLLY